MKLGIINSAFDQAGIDTKTGLEHIARIGFDSVDVFTEAMTIPEKEIQLIESTCAENNLPIVSVVVVAAGLIDFNDPVRDFHLARAKKFVDLAARFKANNLLLVLGEYIWRALDESRRRPRFIIEATTWSEATPPTNPSTPVVGTVSNADTPK